MILLARSLRGLFAFVTGTAWPYFVVVAGTLRLLILIIFGAFFDARLEGLAHEPPYSVLTALPPAPISSIFYPKGLFVSTTTFEDFALVIALSFAGPSTLPFFFAPAALGVASFTICDMFCAGLSLLVIALTIGLRFFLIVFNLEGTPIFRFANGLFPVMRRASSGDIERVTSFKI